MSLDRSCPTCGRRTRWSKVLRAYVCPLWDHIEARRRDEGFMGRLRRRHVDERALYDRLSQ